MPLLSPSSRLRKTPFSKGVEAAGIKAYTVYNHMLLPTVFDTPEIDYRHLKSHVQVWDVSCERQVEITGPDAFKLMQLLTPRDLTKMREDQCYYIPVVNDTGGMLNDPVALRRDEDRWWISIADSDLLFWIKGVAYGLRLNVRVGEPDVSPLAVQGPDAENLMARVFGEAVRDIRFFRHKKLPFNNTSMIVARSGYSKQGGFEIYVEGSDNGMPLWNALFEAGTDLEVRAGCPNLIERIEGGLLSYGNDATAENTPYECGLGKFCNRLDGDYIGKSALENEQRNGPQKQIRAISVPGKPLQPISKATPLFREDKQLGQITSLAWSPDFQTNVAIGMVDKSCWKSATEMTVEIDDTNLTAIIRDKFWI